MSVASERIFTLEGAAKCFDVSIPTFRGWVRRGCPYVRKGSKSESWEFDIIEVAYWRKEQEMLKEAPRISSEFDPEQLPPKDRLDWFKSERERRLLQVQDRELIPAAEVEIEVAALVKSFIGTLDTLPDVLERDAGITGAAAEVAQRVIDAERDRLYERLSQ